MERHVAWLREPATAKDNHVAPYRLRARKRDVDDDRAPCWFCNPPRPLSMFSGGARVDHAWLEQDQQRQVEAADTWLEALLAEAFWRKEYGSSVRINKRLDWRDPAHPLGGHLAGQPRLRQLADQDDGADEIWRWAGVPELEARVFDLALVGWRPAAIAEQLQVRVSTVRQRFRNARDRLRAKGLPVPDSGWLPSSRARARRDTSSYAVRGSHGPWLPKAS